MCRRWFLSIPRHARLSLYMWKGEFWTPWPRPPDFLEQPMQDYLVHQE